jgi:hypothetical protein
MSIATTLYAGGAGVAAFTATDVVVSAPADDLLAAGRAVLDAVRNGQGWLGAALALILATGLARKYGKSYIPFLATDAGGMVLTAVTSFAGACATALAAGSSISGALLLTAAGVAVAAMGGYRVLAKGLLPLLDAAAQRWPNIATKALSAGAHWLLDRTPESVKKAEAAGAAAVAAKPAGGLDAVVGGEHVIK